MCLSSLYKLYSTEELLGNERRRKKNVKKMTGGMKTDTRKGKDQWKMSHRLSADGQNKGRVLGKEQTHHRK